MPHRQSDRPGFTRRMEREEINACPIMAQWTGPVSVVRNGDELDAAMAKLAGQILIGFDTETRPACKVGESYLPSLLLLAGETEVFLLQLKPLGVAPPLCELLADPAIIKTGVSLDYDILELKKLAHFQAGGFGDPGNLAKKRDIKNHGLRGLAAALLGFRISKGAQTSNWDAEILAPHQVLYAATDAWAGRQL